MLKFIKGNVTKPNADGLKIIAHCCNNLGVMGAGVALAISKKWPEIKQEYEVFFELNQRWFRTDKLPLGAVQYIDVEEDIVVANIIGQDGIASSDPKSRKPIRYWALDEGLRDVFYVAAKEKASIHLPKLGSALAGGKWEIIQEIIEELCEAYPQVDVTVYEFGGGK